MLGNLQGWHLIIILVVILLLFGAPKLPGLAKSLGQSMRIFRGEVKQMKDENAPKADSTTATTTTVASDPVVVDALKTETPKPDTKPGD